MSEHGYGRYTNGCRCDVCRAAKVERMREYRNKRRRARDLVKAGGGRNYVSGITHGYSGYQNYICRCRVCVAAATAEARLRHARRKQAAS